MLFADLEGSMELLADRDPEEARDAGSRVWARCPIISGEGVDEGG